MLNPQQIDSIVRRTLRKIGVVDNGIVTLIKGTFAYESGLTDLFNSNNQYNRLYGLMMMSSSKVDEHLDSYMKYRFNEKKVFQEASGVDFDNPVSLKEQLEVNLAAMVIMTYSYYSRFYRKPPSNDIYDVASYYERYWYDGQYDADLVDDFVIYYNDTFG